MMYMCVYIIYKYIRKIKTFNLTVPYKKCTSLMPVFVIDKSVKDFICENASTSILVSNDASTIVIH